MNQKGFSPLIMVLGIILVIGIVGVVYYFGIKNSTIQPRQINPIPTSVATSLPRASATPPANQSASSSSLITPPPASCTSVVNELPPLYSGIKWEATGSGRTLTYLTQSLVFKNLPKDGFNGFIDSYRGYLEPEGWKFTGAGQGPTGYFFEYRKNECLIIFGWRMVAVRQDADLITGAGFELRAFVEHN